MRTNLNSLHSPCKPKTAQCVDALPESLKGASWRDILQQANARHRGERRRYYGGAKLENFVVGNGLGRSSSRAHSKNTFNLGLSEIVCKQANWPVLYEYDYRQAVRWSEGRKKPIPWSVVPRRINELIEQGLAVRVVSPGGNSLIVLKNIDGMIDKLICKRIFSDKRPVTDCNRQPSQIAWSGKNTEEYEDIISASNLRDAELDFSVLCPSDTIGQAAQTLESFSYSDKKQTQNLQPTPTERASSFALPVAKQGSDRQPLPKAEPPDPALDRMHPTQAAFEMTPKGEPKLDAGLSYLKRLGYDVGNLREKVVTARTEPDRFDYTPSISEADSRGYARATAESRRLEVERSRRKSPSRHPPNAAHASVGGLDQATRPRSRRPGLEV